jgi:hypothetical protein
MSGGEIHDVRVRSARAYLQAARPAWSLSRSAAVAEVTELRAMLARLIDVADDAADSWTGEEVTEIKNSGGATVTPADVLTVADALADAVAFRSHRADAHDVATAVRYQRLGWLLGGDR